MKNGMILLALLAAATPAAAAPLEVLPSGHPVGSVEIAGAGTRRFVVDTAAGRTAVVPRLRAAIPGAATASGGGTLAGASGAARVELVRLGRVDVNGRSHQDVEAVAFPAGPVDALGVDGVLGTDVFGRYWLEMDLPGRRWDFHDKGSPALLDGLLPPVPIALDAQRLARVRVLIDGVPVTAILDTGARGSIVNWAAARALGLTPESPGLERGEPVKGATDQAAKSVAARFATLAIGEAVVAGPRMRIADLPVFAAVGFRSDEPAMILGIDMLADRRILVDYPGSRLYISPPQPGQSASPELAAPARPS